MDAVDADRHGQGQDVLVHQVREALVRVRIPVARPIEDVATDLRNTMVKMLPGSQAVQASWAMLGASQEMIAMAKNIFAESNASREARAEGSAGKKFALDTFLWKSHGEYYAACRMIHALADAFKVESVIWREVPDAKEGQAVGGAEQASDEVPRPVGCGDPPG